MTLVQLEYVVALDTLKHFARAAEECHITQPSLSMQVQKLEEELGVQIFIRSTPVTTTETGQVVIEQAKKILAEAGRMHQLIEQEKSIVTGSIKFGILPTLAPYLLPEFIEAFIKIYPNVRLSIHEMTTENIVRQLRNGSLEAGILATPLNHSDLNEEFLFNEEFVAYVSRQEKIFNKKYLLPADINVNSMWLLEEGHCLRSQVMNLCALQKDSSREKHFEYAAGSIETLKRFVEKKWGYYLVAGTCDLWSEQREKKYAAIFQKPGASAGNKPGYLESIHENKIDQSAGSNNNRQPATGDGEEKKVQIIPV